MASDPTGSIVFLILLLILRGWLAAADEALTNLSETKIRLDAGEDDPVSMQLLKLLDERERLCVGLHAGMLLASLGMGITAAVGVALPCAASWRAVNGDVSDGAALAVCCVCATMLTACAVLIMGDRVPRALACRDAERSALRLKGMARFACMALRPLTWASACIAGAALRMLGVRQTEESDEVTEDDIRMLVDMGGETGAIEEDEKEMIDNIFEFNNRSAEEVMTHRTDVTGIWVEAEKNEIIRTILDSGLSRFPVYGEDIDDILGVLNARDYLLNAYSEKPRTLRQLLREAYFVPEHVQADVLLRDLQKRKVHLAIVVDEYGGMSGVITLEDLLEEIVGNIYDEFDEQGEAEITALGDNLWRISGTASLEDVAEALDVDLPTEEDYDTLGGLVFNQLTVIPEDGSTPEVEAAGLRIRVERMADHRVESALVSRVTKEKGGDEPHADEEESSHE